MEKSFVIFVFFEEHINACRARRKSGQWNKPKHQRRREAAALLRGGKVRKI